MFQQWLIWNVWQFECLIVFVFYLKMSSDLDQFVRVT